MSAQTRVNVRPATPDDATAIATVHIRSWQETYTGQIPADYLARLDDSIERRAGYWRRTIEGESEWVFVAEINGQVVGFASCGAAREGLGRFDSELYTIYLLRQAQGMEAGKTLFRAIVRTLCEQGFTSMIVWVLATNEPAKAFYVRMGAQYITDQEFELERLRLKESAFGWSRLCEPPTG